MTNGIATPEAAHELIVEAIEFVAPDIDARSISRVADVRLEAELDSIDFISVLTAIRDRTGIDIPETDYPRCHTVDGLIGYLVEHSSGPARDPR